MGAPRGFIKHDRLLPDRRAVPVRLRDWKLIHNERSGPAANTDELYYLRDDPNEELNLSEDPAAAWSLERRQAELAVLKSRARGDAVNPKIREAAPAPEERERRRSLGYTALAEDVCGSP